MARKAHAFAATSSLESLEDLYQTSTYDPGWYNVGDNQRLINTVLNVTNTSTLSTQAIAVNGKATAEMWDEQRRIGSTWAQKADGWYATLKLTAILLDTACVEVPGHALGSWEASSSHNGTISLAIGPMAQSDDAFKGATCTISVKQVLIGKDISQIHRRS